MRRVLLCSLAFAIAAAGAVTVDDAVAREDQRFLTPSEYLDKRIKHWRGETWRWQRLMARPRTPASDNLRRTQSLDYKRWVLKLWKQRAGRVWLKAKNPPHKRAWLCIHRHEGAWNDPNAPYYGGLQMDESFMRSYGPHLLRKKGTADNWTPLEQMWIAERAHRSGRGFYPWPNTARYCGLI
jgi:hypothetical protein